MINSLNEKDLINSLNKNDLIKYLNEKNLNEKDLNKIESLNLVKSLAKDEKYYDFILEETIIEKEKLYLKEMIKSDNGCSRENKLKKR